MQVEIFIQPALSAEQIEKLLPPAKFAQLMAVVTLGKSLLDEVEDNLLRGAAAEWSPEELERYVGFCEPEPEASPQLGRLAELFRTALCGPKPPEPIEGESNAR